MSEDEKQEKLANKGLDNAYRFDNNHLIRPKIEIDEDIDEFPGYIQLNKIITFNPRTNAFNESQLCA
jgi:hypothetical protein